MGFRDSHSAMLHVRTTERHGDGDGIVNHSISSGVPEKAPYEMINQFFHVFFSKSNIAPPTHEKL